VGQFKFRSKPSRATPPSELALLGYYDFTVVPAFFAVSVGNIDDLRRFNYIFIGPVTTVCHTALKKFVIRAQISIVPVKR
jgi:hypothetical protein